MKIYVYTITEKCPWTDQWETSITGVVNSLPNNMLDMISSEDWKNMDETKSNICVGKQKMLKTEIKTKQLEELRPGNHHQIQGTLKDQFDNGEYGYCCLGVPADKVMGLEVLIVDENILNDEGDRKIYDEVNDLLTYCFSIQCSHKNDTGWVFAEITDFIENEWNPPTEETV